MSGPGKLKALKSGIIVRLSVQWLVVEFNIFTMSSDDLN